jgi:hypothetical protein
MKLVGSLKTMPGFTLSAIPNWGLLEGLSNLVGGFNHLEKY